MRNIISVQLERPSRSESLMVYSKCLMNFKMETPARNTDLSAAILCRENKHHGTVVRAEAAKYQWEKLHQLMRMRQELWKSFSSVIFLF